jgi:hypothetical protein
MTNRDAPAQAKLERGTLVVDGPLGRHPPMILGGRGEGGTGTNW